MHCKQNSVVDVNVFTINIPQYHDTFVDILQISAALEKKSLKKLKNINYVILDAIPPLCFDPRHHQHV